MAEKEIEIINHLLEVEQLAEQIADNARIEADRKISEASNAADKLFREKYEQIVKENEEKFSVKKSDIVNQYNSKILEYKNRISSSQKDVLHFEEFLDKVLFA